MKVILSLFKNWKYKLFNVLYLCGNSYEKKSYNIVTLNSGSTGHYYNYKFKFQSIFIALTLCVRNYHKIYSPKLIKFTQDSRGMINLFMKKDG